MQKRTINEIKGYLGTGVRCQVMGEIDIKGDPVIFTLEGINKKYVYLEAFGYEGDDNYDMECVFSALCLILKPMEMFDEEQGDKYQTWAVNNGVLVNANEIDNIITMSRWINNNMGEFTEFSGDIIFLDYLYQNHYDIHNLIGKNLAVDWRDVYGDKS